MRLFAVLSTVLATVSVAFSAAVKNSAPPPDDSLQVPKCPQKATVSFDKSVPDANRPFPRTTVDVCYDETSIRLAFKAFEEESFFFDPNHKTNGDIWTHEVMEAFIYKGDNDPQTYFEFEVSPNNVTYQAFVYNPSKVRSKDAPLDHFFVADPAADGFSATTELNREAKTWFSEAVIPLALFSIESAQLSSSHWRMNFFRTVTSPENYPNQDLGAWKNPGEANFHITSSLGLVNFV